MTPPLSRLLRSESAPVTHSDVGPLFEGWVASVLRAYRDYRGLFEAWSYWAPSDAARLEVDFLLRRGNEYVAIEAKAGRAHSPDDVRGLRAIADLPGLIRRLVVCRAPRPRRTDDGIEIVPVDDFLGLLEADRLWP